MDKIAIVLVALALALTLFGGLSQNGTGQSKEFEGMWLVGDHHMHTMASDGSHTMEYDVEHSKGLDFIVVTNHGSSDNLAKIEAEYQELLRLRKENPEMLIFYGFEWNVPSGEHATFIVEPGTRELDQIREFMLRFDENTNRNATKEVDAVRALAYAETMNPKPIVIMNHPSRKGKYSLTELRAYDNAGTVAVGFEGAPGHQANPDRGSYPAKEQGSSRTYGGYDIMSAKVGGYWDTMLSEGRRWFITSNSDFHEHHSENGDDFWPGEYSKTYVNAKERSYKGIMDALRSGNYFAVSGDLIKSLDMSAESKADSATMGSTLKAERNSDITVKIRVEDGERNRNGKDPVLKQVQLISNVTGKPEIIKVFNVSGNNESKGIEYTFENVQKNFYVRIRGSDTDETEPSEDPEGEDAWSDMWFYSNPIFIEV
jgi:hypothetical protein